MYQFLMFIVVFFDFCAERQNSGVRTAARQGLGWMLLATVLNVSLWSWAGQAHAQGAEWDVVALMRQPVSPQQARLVVYRTANDDLPDQTLVRINGSYLANLQRASYVVVCMPAQSVVLSLSEGSYETSLDPIDVSVPLSAGQTRYILASDAPDRALVFYGLTVEHAGPDLLSAQAAVRSRSRFKQVQPCQPYPGSREDSPFMEAANRVVNAIPQ